MLAYKRNEIAQKKTRKLHPQEDALQGNYNQTKNGLVNNQDILVLFHPHAVFGFKVW